MENSIKIFKITSFLNLLIVAFGCKSKAEPLVIIKSDSTCYSSNFEKELLNDDFLEKFYNSDNLNFTTKSLEFQHEIFFDNGKKYLLVKSKTPPVNTIYLQDHNKLVEILCFDTGADYKNYVISDVNDDHFKDIVVNQSSAGNIIASIFLQNPNDGTFKTKYELPNPTFDGKGVARGFLRQQSPIIQLYKMKFNQLKMDTIESVFYNSDEIIPMYIKTNGRNPFITDANGEYTYSVQSKEAELSALPEEYKKLDNLIFK